MADGNLHLVIAAGDDAATRARVEAMVEATPVLSLFAAHNVVVAQKP